MVVESLAGQSALRTDRDRIDAARAIFIDWDGCLAWDNRVAPSVARLIASRAERFVIISNNSTQLPEDFARILARGGCPFPPERIILAGTEAVRRLARRQTGGVQMYATTRMRAYAMSLGLRLERENAAQVLLMRDTRFTYTKLLRAANALIRGASLVVANADRSHPSPGNMIVPETGALLAALRACAPDIEPEIIGKPAPLLFRMACEIAGVAAHEAVMIGDNPETDGAGAAACGIQPILVGGGSHRRLEDLVS